jgi:hypothetical protein
VGRESGDTRKEFFYSRPLLVAWGLWFIFLSVGVFAAAANSLLGTPFLNMLEGEAHNSYVALTGALLFGLGGCIIMLIAVGLFYGAARNRPFVIIASEGIYYRQLFRYRLIHWREICGVTLFRGVRPSENKPGNKIILMRCEPANDSVNIHLFLYLGDKDAIYNAIRKEWRRRSPN